MMGNRISMLAVVVAMVVGGSAGVAFAASAAGATTFDLGPAGFGAIAVDSVNAHVLISEPLADRVVVLDYAGAQVATIPNEFGAAAMAVHDGVVYVVQSTTGSIDRFDAASFKKLGKLTKNLDHPVGLEFAGDRLWTTVPGAIWSTLASVDPTSGKKHIFDVNVYEPLLATSPGLPTSLFVTETGLSPGDVVRYDVSSGAPVVAASTSNTFGGENCRDLTVSSDGTRVVPACGAPYEFDELHASTMQADGIVYPANAYPSAVASTTGTGASLFAGAFSGHGSVVEIFKYRRPRAVLTAKSSSDVLSQGMAFSGDGDSLFVMSTLPKPDGLHVLLSILPVLKP